MLGIEIQDAFLQGNCEKNGIKRKDGMGICSGRAGENWKLLGEYKGGVM